MLSRRRGQRADCADGRDEESDGKRVGDDQGAVERLQPRAARADYRRDHGNYWRGGSLEGLVSKRTANNAIRDNYGHDDIENDPHGDFQYQGQDHAGDWL